MNPIRLQVEITHTGGHSTPHLGLDVVTKKTETYKPGNGNPNARFEKVAEGIYEIY